MSCGDGCVVTLHDNMAVERCAEQPRQWQVGHGSVVNKRGELFQDI
jgi:hypothetical protein